MEATKKYYKTTALASHKYHVCTIDSMIGEELLRDELGLKNADFETIEITEDEYNLLTLKEYEDSKNKRRKDARKRYKQKRRNRFLCAKRCRK